MAAEIRQASSITDEELERLFNWGENIFGITSFTLTWRPKDEHFFMDVDGVPVSHAGLLKHEIVAGRRRLTVAGLGGVVTIPEAQHRGYARRLVEHAAEFFEREWKVDAGLLFCLERMMPYYESMGWRLLEETVIIEQPSGQIRAPLPVMIRPCSGRSWPAGEVLLQSLPW